MDFAHVDFDHLMARNELKNMRGVCEIKHQRRNHRQIATVVLIKLHVGAIGESLTRPSHHLAADIHRVHFAK